MMKTELGFEGLWFKPELVADMLTCWLVAEVKRREEKHTGITFTMKA
jgi:hypothetical protein